MNELISVHAAAELIRRGVPLSLAGPEAALDQLPAGPWIGGTIPYFMVAGGGTVVQDDQVFATHLSGLGTVNFACYSEDELSNIAGQTADNGFALTILPAGCAVHQRFAAEAATYEDAFLKPAVGWIAGVHLSQLGQATPKVYDGRTATKHDNRAVVAHVALQGEQLPSVEIVNIFEPGDGDTLRFTDTSFTVGDCEVNGQRTNLADYLQRQGLDHGRLPLVGDFAGAHINVSIQRVDAEARQVHLYAPVFPGVDYHVAQPVADYAAAFRARLAEQSAEGAVLGCNCILNFVFGELEGKAIGGVPGPVTFGEIAYQLLNQTMVVLRIQ